MENKPAKKSGKLYKDASGKTGSLMDVVSSPNYGIDTRGDAKAVHYSPGLILPDNDLILSKELNAQIKEQKMKEDYEKMQKILKEENDAIEEYNANLTTIDPVYGNLKLLGYNVLVRLYAAPHMTQSGITIPDMLYKPLKSGLDGVKTNDVQENPFRFRNYGVVITSGSDNIQQGQKVQIRREIVQPYFDKEKWVYTEPNIVFYFKEKTDVGYVLVREMDIQAIYE